MINLTEHCIIGNESEALHTSIRLLLPATAEESLSRQRNRGAALRAKVDAAAAILGAAIDAGEILMSPFNFTKTGCYVSNDVVRALLLQSKRCAKMKQDIQYLGVYSRVCDDISTEQTTKSMSDYVDRLVVSIIACSDTPEAAEMTSQDAIAWLQFHYDEENRTFSNTGLWGGNGAAAGKCLRAFAAILGEEFGEEDMLLLTLTRRTAEMGYKHAMMLKDPPKALQNWVALWLLWRETVPPTTDGGRQGLKVLSLYLQELDARGLDVTSPEAILTEPPPLSLFEFIKARHLQGSATSQSVIAASQLIRFSEFLNDHLQIASRAIFYRPLLTRSEESAVKGLQDPSSKTAPLGKVAASGMPRRLAHFYREMLLAGAAGWCGTYYQCRHSDGSYNPTLPYLFLLADELASRVGELARIDSGEGDLVVLDLEKMTFVENTGPHAGYWKREQHEEHNRGYARRSPDGGVIGIYMNTNKTGPSRVVPWQNIFAHSLMHDLAAYQRVHTPIAGPISPSTYLSAPELADAKKLMQYPYIFPLFRMPRVGRKMCGSPVTAYMRNRFWCDSQEELQRLWNEASDADEQIDIITYNEFNQPKKSFYTPHGLRSATVTRLAESGLGLEVISELVGHSSRWMTAKYSKPNSRSMSEKLEAINATAADPATQQAVRELRLDGVQAAHHLVPSSHQTLFHALPENGGDLLKLANQDTGICTTDGQGCSNGGPLLRSGKRKGSTDQDLYGIVIGGNGNCFLCRHFMTGPKWEDGVEAHGNLCLWRIEQTGKRIAEIQEKLQAAEISYSVIEPNSPQRLPVRQEISRLEMAINDLIAQQEILAETAIAAKRKLEEIAAARDLQVKGGFDPNSALIVSDQKSLIDWKETSHFERTLLLRAYGRVYVSLYDPQVDAQFKEIVNQVAFRSGYEPICLRRLTAAEKEKQYDRAMEMIAAKASSFDFNRLDNDIVSLDELGISAEEAESVFGGRISPTVLQLGAEQ